MPCGSGPSISTITLSCDYYGDSETIILYPNSSSAALVTGVPPQSDANLYLNIDEEECDASTSYVYTDQSIALMIVGFQNLIGVDPSYEFGYLKLNACVASLVFPRCPFGDQWDSFFFGIEDGSLPSKNQTDNLAEGDFLAVEGVWKPYSYIWTLNPLTGQRWTAANINALNIWIHWYNINMCGALYSVSQLNLEVVYRPTYNQEVKLPYPSKFNVDHTIDTKSLNFQSNDSKSYGVQRNNKTLTLSGLMWDGCTDGSTTCTEIIENIRTMSKRLEKIDISGFAYPSFNGEYNIISFIPNQISQQPNVYEWELKLEFVD